MRNHCPRCQFGARDQIGWKPNTNLASETKSNLVPDAKCNEQTIEHTSEHKTPCIPEGSRTGAPFDLLTPPIGVDRDAWADWIAHRRKRRKPVSERAAVEQWRALACLSPPQQAACIAHSIRNDYRACSRRNSPMQPIDLTEIQARIEARQGVSAPTSPETGRRAAAVAGETVWQLMGSMYGHRWTSSFGDSVDPDRVWAATLAGLNEAQVRYGMRQCVAQGHEWPPSAPEFRKLCLRSSDVSWEHKRRGRRSRARRTLYAPAVT